MSKQVKKTPKINKAGCVVMGRSGPDGEMSLLVPYNEGRFAQNGEFFVLPKGSVDEGEDVFDAALRETSEETGINIRSVLGEKAIAQLRAGKDVRDVKSEGYPGVTILKASAKPYRHDYLSRAGVKHRLALFRIEVDGIEKIAEHPDLKNNQRAQTRDLIKDHEQRPKFPRFMNWMERGYIPIDAPVGHPEHDKRNGSGDIIPLHPVKWFKGLVNEFAPEGKIIVHTNDNTNNVDWDASRKHWQEFCKKLPPADYKQLMHSFQTIKSHIKRAGWLEGDKALLKFDEKDCPLFYYTEGARVVPAKEYIAKIFYDLEQNPDYACAFGGQCEITRQFKPQRTIAHSQLAAIGPFIEPIDYVEAAAEAVKRNGGKLLTWQQGDCEPCEKPPRSTLQSSERVVQALINTRAAEVLGH